jgi:serine/threonine protein kinase
MGIIHRDVHPTRLHYNNGLCILNLIGLPYNFKKIIKCTNYAGHVSYSAPEIVNQQIQAHEASTSESENNEIQFTEKAETW